MAEARECPLCGTTMRVRHSERVVSVPGNARPTTHQMAEWVCPECDYFEEVEKD